MPPDTSTCCGWKSETGENSRKQPASPPPFPNSNPLKRFL
jgi:hypothetical protein